MPAASNTPRDSRRHYRIRYPLRLRPRLEVAGLYAVVIDLSEGGVRIVNEAQLPLAPGAVVKGALVLQSGEAARFSGSVVRVTPEDIALCLAQGFSYAVILREQRRLRARRPYLR
jgi:hypothetical protein